MINATVVAPTSAVFALATRDTMGISAIAEEAHQTMVKLRTKPAESEFANNFANFQYLSATVQILLTLECHNL